MRKYFGTLLSCGISAALTFALAPAANATNLLTNGNFASSNNGFSELQTPVGWTNVGHTDGVISDSNFSTPAYGGSTYYYDLGGYGGALPGVGDGIEQTVTTSIGTTYNLSLGYANENVAGGPEYLNVLVNGSLLQHILMVQNGAFGAFELPWTTDNLSFTASSSSSTVEFTVTGSNLGSDDPLIAGVDLEGAGTVSSTPEPSSLMLLGTGVLGMAGAMRRKMMA